MDILLKYFPDMEPFQREQLHHFRKEISLWNNRLNLISRVDIAHLEEKHILHSLGIAAIHPFPDSCRVLDVGTGGGFPGIPLAILYPRSRFTLIDSIGKKVNAVREITASLGLSNVEVRQVRAEMLEDRYHYIVSRAVTGLHKFTGWMKGRLLAPCPEFPGNGILYLKGGDLEQELISFPLARVHSLNQYFSEPFFETKKLVYLPFKALS